MQNSKGANGVIIAKQRDIKVANGTKILATPLDKTFIQLWKHTFNIANFRNGFLST